MNKIAHAVFGAPGFDTEKKDQANQAQHEIQEAKRIQRQTGCTWSEALKAAAHVPNIQEGTSGHPTTA